MKDWYKKVFYVLVGIFVLLVLFFMIPEPRMFFPAAAVLAVLFFILGGVLIFLVRKLKKGKLKLFLMLTGFSAIGFLLGSILHNLFYALGTVVNITWLSFLIGFFEGLFFLIAIPICPIVFLVGVIGAFLSLREQ